MGKISVFSFLLFLSLVSSAQFFHRKVNNLIKTASARVYGYHTSIRTKKQLPVSNVLRTEKNLVYAGIIIRMEN